MFASAIQSLSRPYALKRSSLVPRMPHAEVYEDRFPGKTRRVYIHRAKRQSMEPSRPRNWFTYLFRENFLDVARGRDSARRDMEELKARLPKRHPIPKPIPTNPPEDALPRRRRVDSIFRRVKSDPISQIPKRGSLINPLRSHDRSYIPSYDSREDRSRSPEVVVTRQPRSRTPVRERVPPRSGRWVSPDRDSLRGVLPGRRGRPILSVVSDSSSEGPSKWASRPKVVQRSPVSTSRRTPLDEVPGGRPSVFRPTGPPPSPRIPRAVERSPHRSLHDHVEVEEVRPRRPNLHRPTPRRRFSSSEDETVIEQERSPRSGGRSFITRSPTQSSNRLHPTVIQQGRSGLSESAQRVLRKTQPNADRRQVHFDLP